MTNFDKIFTTTKNEERDKVLKQIQSTKNIKSQKVGQILDKNDQKTIKTDTKKSKRTNSCFSGSLDYLHEIAKTGEPFASELERVEYVCSTVMQKTDNREESMRLLVSNWLRVLLSNMPAFKNIIDILDDIVESRATLFGVGRTGLNQMRENTLTQIETTIDIIQRKKSILSLRMIAHELYDCLDANEKLMVRYRYHKRYSSVETAERMKIHPKSVLRCCKRILNSLAGQCIARGMDSPWFLSICKTEFWLLKWF